MIEVVTGSRLHFGLLNPSPTGPSLLPLSPEGRGVTGRGERRFGGAGMMLEQPSFRLLVSAASEWSADGPLAERTLAFARRIAQGLEQEGVTLRPQRLEVVSAPPEHTGLGTGTQLGMAVARALAVAAGREDLGVAELARLAGRGLRSGVGVHGFGRGGFLVEAGQRSEVRGQKSEDREEKTTSSLTSDFCPLISDLAPLLAWSAVPRDWRVVLVLPHAEGTWHGEREREAFSRLAASGPAVTERLCRLVLLGMLPALAEADIDTFGEAVHEYNALAGEAFAAVQGGTYASAAVAEMVAFIRGLGVKGVGQSSWGPAVFAIVGEQDAEALRRRLSQQWGLGEQQVLSAPVLNHGATVTQERPSVG